MGTELVYAQARYYSADTKVFLSSDPYSLDSYNTTGYILNPSVHNTYGYAGNSPMKYTDPDGRCFGPLLIGCIAAAPYVIAGLEVAGAAISAYTMAHTAGTLAGTALSPAPQEYKDAVYSEAANNAAMNISVLNGMGLKGGIQLKTESKSLVVDTKKSINNLESLKGSSIEEVMQIIPNDWIRSVARDGKGIKYVNPNVKGEQIIIERGSLNPSSKDNVHAGDYLRVSRDGKVERIPLKGNPSIIKTNTK